MEKLVIRGGKILKGEINIDAAKNSVLPIIACCILSSEDILIKNAPKITDIHNMLSIIKSIGGKAEFCGDDILINCKNANPGLVSADLTGGIRSSIFILGSILSRFKYANISYPGGCEIGLRPIDLHIYGLKCLNVHITESDGRIICDGSKIIGSTVDLDFPSVGATENIMMAGVLSSGTTIIRNAAREPEIVDLQNFINFLGGRVSGAGTGIITVEGVSKLGGGTYRPIGDRIAAGTFLCGCAMTGGEIKVNNIEPELLYSVLEKLRRCGCEIIEEKNSAVLRAKGRIKPIHKLETQPFPGFPTDMQPQFTAMLCIADGSSFIVENMFESRFKFTAQLCKMGANILVKDRIAMVKGVKTLGGTLVSSEDLRGGAALILAGLKAEGITTVANIHHVDRGYFAIESALKGVGADIVREQCIKENM